MLLVYVTPPSRTCHLFLLHQYVALQLLLEEVEDALVGGSVRVAKVEPVAGAGDNGGVEGLGPLEHGLGHGEDVGRVAHHDLVAVAAAEGHVVLAGDDLDRAGEVAGLGGAVADGEKLAEGSGLAVHGGVVEHRLGEVAGAEEVNVHADGVLGRDVAGGILAPEPVADLGDGRKVGAEGEEGHVVGRLGEAREDNGVGDVGVLGGQRVGHGGAERVADVHLLAEAVVGEAAEVALVGHLGQLVQGLDLEAELDLLDGVAVGGLRDAEAVPGERRVAGVEGVRDVRVVVAREGVVPVGAVEADAMGEDLERGGRTGLGVADCGGEGVVFLDVGVVLVRVSHFLSLSLSLFYIVQLGVGRPYVGDDFRHEIGAVAGEAEEKVGRVNLLLGGLVVELLDSRVDGNGDLDIVAVLAVVRLAGDDGTDKGRGSDSELKHYGRGRRYTGEPKRPLGWVKL